MTQSDLITAALIEIGVVAPGETASAQDLATASTILQHMMDAWQAERLYIFALARQVFIPAALKQTYTLGLTGDFNVARPAKIERYAILNLANVAQPVELPLDSLTAAQWAAIPVKNVPSAFPSKVWDDQQYPLRNLNYWPVPTTNIQFIIYNWVALTTWPDLFSDITFPPGYLEALRYALAIRLAPAYGAAAMVTPDLKELAKDAKRRIKIMNAPMIDLKCDPMLVSHDKAIYDWRTDQYTGKG